MKRAIIFVRWSDEQEYVRDLAKCRRTLLQREIEGDFDNTDEFAASIGLSSTTVRKWLSGVAPCRETTTNLILDGLRLRFDDVHTPVASLTPYQATGSD